MAALAELAGSRELLANLTSRELRGKYKRSALGWSWSLVNPLALTLIFTLIFSVVFRGTAPVGRPSGLKAFPLYLLCGLLPWNFLSNGVTGSINALTGNANLVKKVYFPREVLVAAAVLSWDVSLAIELSVLSVVLMVFGNLVLPWLPVLVLVAALQTLFVLGIGLLLAVLNVYFRDVQHFVAIFMQLWFYLTPVIYPISYIARHDRPLGPVHLLTLYRLNPMVEFAEAYHRVLYDLRMPPLTQWAAMTAAAGLALAAGYAVFRRLEPRLAEEL